MSFVIGWFVLSVVIAVLLGFLSRPRVMEIPSASLVQALRSKGYQGAARNAPASPPAPAEDEDQFGAEWAEGYEAGFKDGLTHPGAGSGDLAERLKQSQAANVYLNAERNKAMLRVLELEAALGQGVVH